MGVTAAAPRLGGDPLSVFGQIVTGSQVEAALMVTLRKWMRTYVREMERQDGWPAGSLPEVRSWTVANDLTKLPGEQIPAVIVRSTGISERPRVDGDGVYTADWDVSVSSICAAASREVSNQLAKLYTSAVRAVLVQQVPADGLVSSVNWTGDTYTDIPQERQRMVAEGNAAFLVSVTDVLSRYKGPLEPDDDPGDLGTVEDVYVDALASRAGSGQPPDLMHLVHERGEP